MTFWNNGERMIWRFIVDYCEWALQNEIRFYLHYHHALWGTISKSPIGNFAPKYLGGQYR